MPIFGLSATSSSLSHFTTSLGSKEHNVAIRARAQQRGLKLNEYELAGSDHSIPCKNEAEIFGALSLDYIAPELREDTGEIQAAEEHKLPVLIEPRDIHGVFHCHTTWSDGVSSLEEMAQAARSLGFNISVSPITRSR